MSLVGAFTSTAQPIAINQCTLCSLQICLFSLPRGITRVREVTAYRLRDLKSKETDRNAAFLVVDLVEDLLELLKLLLRKLK